MNNKFKTKPYLPPSDITPNSDVESIAYDGATLVVTIACSSDDKRNIKGMKITFPLVWAFRVLDECDLARYWISDEDVGGSHLTEVIEGGWNSEEAELRGLEENRREWLVATGNLCVSVFCENEPIVAPLSWLYEGD